jgi:CrcB protein
MPHRESGGYFLARTGGRSRRSSPGARSVNITACFLLGYFVTRLQERLPLSSYRRPLVGTGLCGGLSTFSTMQVEIVKMLGAHAWGLAAGYTAASIGAGYIAIHLASAMVRRTRVRQQRVTQ